MTNTMQPRDRWIPWYFVAFFVGLAIVDGIMVNIAVSTNPGIVTKHPYERGLDYNQIVKASDMQNSLGWKGEISYRPESKDFGKLIFTLKDKTGVVLRPDNVSSAISRPMQGEFDSTVKLLPNKSGSFEADVRFPLKGLWDLRIYAKSGENTYQQSKRIVLE